jgi:hypothetical protein
VLQVWAAPAHRGRREVGDRRRRPPSSRGWARLGATGAARILQPGARGSCSSGAPASSLPSAARCAQSGQPPSPPRWAESVRDAGSPGAASGRSRAPHVLLAVSEASS